jgi:lambda repressor-like predicted transcriptional regulator
MPKPDTVIDVIGKVGTIPNARAQLAALARKKGTSIPEVAEKIGVSKQRLYALLSSEQIKESQLAEILAAMNARPSELHI